MAQDYAKRKRKNSSGGRNRRKKSTASNSGNGWRIYGAGVLTGVFLSFLVYLNSLAPAQTTQAVEPPPAKPAEPEPKLQFDFYNKLRERTAAPRPPPLVEPARDVARPAAAETFVLQAGSFRQRDDADRRRAELLLLGLEPAIEESTGDNGRWFRVVLGPFATRAEMNRVRGLTAGQNIDTLQLKRHRP